MKDQQKSRPYVQPGSRMQGAFTERSNGGLGSRGSPLKDQLKSRPYVQPGSRIQGASTERSTQVLLGSMSSLYTAVTLGTIKVRINLYIIIIKTKKHKALE